MNVWRQAIPTERKKYKYLKTTKTHQNKYIQSIYAK